ncbi:MAG TPA: 3-dehydro-L-gulonate 2-dehydrogenase [Gemmatimonadaceae bacterium]|nr:3-dehydro-L-gulonate 2-dehydrogenase [Gemmatimonadaceae bacterium]
MRVPYEELFETLRRVLEKTGFKTDRAGLCARLFADASRDGFASHGLNRFPRFMRTIRTGVVDVHASPVRVAGFGAWERWDGRLGPGNLNAHQCMDRALALAREHGMGCIALANTNHWMRGGSYGWQAADAGAIGVCWTNTLPNLPPWGVSNPRVGNNPLIIAVPRAGGHVVLDMAMSQFSMGALESYRLRGEPLPVPGGYDERGELTRDPAAIEASMRPLPIGFWKGSGLALVLDLAAAVLSGGAATYQIPTEPEKESGLSQVVHRDCRAFARACLTRRRQRHCVSTHVRHARRARALSRGANAADAAAQPRGWRASGTVDLARSSAACHGVATRRHPRAVNRQDHVRSDPAAACCAKRARRNAGSGDRSSSSRDAMSSPMAGPNLKPWPEPPPASQTFAAAGCRSTTKCASGVLSY